MSEYKIGYGNPPRDSRFKAGNNANPKGRPKRKPLALAKIMQEFEGQLSRYTESGRTKTARRQDLISKKIVNDAVKGDVKSADMLLSLWQHLLKSGDAGSPHPSHQKLASRPPRSDRRTEESGLCDWWRIRSPQMVVEG
jgi:Family of unknown function (DUF5681)